MKGHRVYFQAAKTYNHPWRLIRSEKNTSVFTDRKLWDHWKHENRRPCIISGRY